jgi:hypothetical protein
MLDLLKRPAAACGALILTQLAAAIPAHADSIADF